MKISLVYCDRLLFSYHYVLTFNTNAINLPAPSGSCSEFRTMQLQGPYVEAPSRNCNTTSIITMPSRYCTRLHWLPVQQRITYKWQFWRTKFGARPLRLTWTTEWRNVSAAQLYVHLPSRCWSNRSPGQSFRLFQACFSIFSTVCLELAATNSSHQRLYLFLNLDLKLFYYSCFHWILIRPATSACEVTTV